MENTYFTILKWWIAQRPQEKIFVLLIVMIATVGIVSFKLYGQKEAIEQSRLEDRKEYERQSNYERDKALKRSDSLRNADRIDCQTYYQNISNDKEKSIKLRTQKISNALK